MSVFVSGTRTLAEGFASIWSALMLMMLSIGGTMIMRKFHNSMAVGFFMGAIVAMSQMFFLLFLMYVPRAFLTDNIARPPFFILLFLLVYLMRILSSLSFFRSCTDRYIGYGKDQSLQGRSYKGETVMSMLCLIQSILLGSFAAILGAHRSEILDKPSSYEEMQDFPIVSNSKQRPTDS